MASSNNVSQSQKHETVTQFGRSAWFENSHLSVFECNLHFRWSQYFNYICKLINFSLAKYVWLLLWYCAHFLSAQRFLHNQDSKYRWYKELISCHVIDFTVNALSIHRDVEKFCVSELVYYLTAYVYQRISNFQLENSCHSLHAITRPHFINTARTPIVDYPRMRSEIPLQVETAENNIDEPFGLVDVIYLKHFILYVRERC